MEQPNINVDNVVSNDMEYENYSCRNSDTYDHIEMQPHSDKVDAKDRHGGNARIIVPSDAIHNTSLKKRFCYGIVFAVITLLVVVVVVVVVFALSSKSHGGNCKTHANIRSGEIIRSTGTRHGDLLEIQCNENSTLNGSNTIVCLSTGMWSEDTNCVPKDCGAFVIPKEMMAESDTKQTTVGSMISLSCKDGFSMSGKNVVTCQGDEMWSESPKCEPVDCGTAMITHAEPLTLEKTTYNASFKVNCANGYELVGSEKVTCNVDGQWDDLPVCKIISCGIPDIPEHASITNLTETITHAEPLTLEKTTYNASFKVNCANGYALVGSEKVTCNVDGQWDDLPVCKIISCGMPDIPEHASITNLTETTFQSMVSMKCDEGFLTYGNPEISCTSSGNWTDLPICKPDFCELSPCLNGACLTNDNNYTCICSDGYGGFNCEEELTDCLDILNHGGNTSDGIYTIRTWKTHQGIKVYCDMTTAGGGWTVFQYRFDKSVDFYRNFSEYERGFGDLKAEFWLGLKFVQEIASQSLTHLRIDVEAENGTTAFETYDMFKLSTKPAYILYLGHSISFHRISQINRFGRRDNGCSSFSTYDNDVDSTYGNCASIYKGGWWYNNCFGVDLNGRIIYYHGFILNGHLKSSRMMLKRNLPTK